MQQIDEFLTSTAPMDNPLVYTIGNYTCIISDKEENDIKFYKKAVRKALMKYANETLGADASEKFKFVLTFENVPKGYINIITRESKSPQDIFAASVVHL